MTDTVVVTGGRGRSGRWICDHLAGEYHVVCVDRDHPGWEIPTREYRFQSRRRAAGVESGTSSAK